MRDRNNEAFKICDSRKRRSSIITAAFLIVSLSFAGISSVHAQYFGKNKINYDQFKWRVHESEHYEVYYYEVEKESVMEVVTMAERAYLKLSRDLNHVLEDKIPLVLYRNRTHFRQTNIILDMIPRGVAGFSEPIKNRIVIPISGKRDDLKSLITHELTHSFTFDLFIASRYTDLSKIPLWIAEGLAEYIAMDWSAVGLMILRDAVVNDLIPPLVTTQSFGQFYSGYLGYQASHSLVEYIADEYGMKAFRDFLWELRKKLKSDTFLKDAVEKTFDKEAEELNREWLRYLRRKYAELESKKEFPSDYGKTLGSTKTFYSSLSPVWAPAGQGTAYIQQHKDRLEIFLDSWDEDTEKICLTCGEYDRMDFHYMETSGKALAWSPSGEYLAFFGLSENTSSLYLFDVITKSHYRRYDLPLDEVSNPCFSPDGDRVVFAAYGDGQSDIFILDLETEEIINLTNDEHYDETPAWSPAGDSIVFSSERGRFSSLVMHPLDRESEERMLTDDKGNDIEPSFSSDGKMIAFVSDRNQLINDLYIYDMDTGKIRRLTNVFGGNFAPAFSPDDKEIAFSSFEHGAQKICRIDADRNPLNMQSDSKAEFYGLPDYVEEKEKKWPAYTPESSQLGDKNPGFTLLPDFYQAGIGYTSDGVLFADGAVIFSDMLGHHRLIFSGGRVTNQSSIFTQYFYLRKRWDVGLQGFRYSDYYYYDGKRYTRNVTGGAALFSWPFDLFRRIEFSYSFYEQDDDTAELTYYDPVIQVSLFTTTFVADSVLWAPFGPSAGRRYFLSYAYPLRFNDQIVDFDIKTFDFRQYIKLTKRSLIAARLLHKRSDGENPDFFFLGGVAGLIYMGESLNLLRGYEYAEFFGTRVGLMNVELRFPLINHINFAGGLTFSGIRGVIFLDYGAAWDDWDDVHFKEKNVNGRKEEGTVKGSLGLGIKFYIFGLELHFDFARKIKNMTDLENDVIYQFSIRQNF